MTNITNKTRNAEILNAIESELWRAVDSRNDAEDSKFQDEWEREDMMIGKWFNRMVECGKFHKDSASSKVVKDALADIWSDVLPGIIKAQAAVFYDALDAAGVLDEHDEVLEYFYCLDESDQLFSVQFNDDGDDVEITADNYFAGFVKALIDEYKA